MSKFKKLLLSLGVAATPALTFAQDGDTTDFDLGDAVADLQDGVTSALGEVGPAIVAVVVAAVALWAVPFAWRKIKGAAGR